MRSLLLLVFFMICFGTFSQVKVEATPTGKHAKAVNTVKGKKAEVKRRKQQIKDTKKLIKEQKKARKLYLKKYDSIRSLQPDSIRFRRDLPDSLKWTDVSLPDSLKWIQTSLPDSLKWVDVSMMDSLQIAEQVLSSTGFPDKYKDLVLAPPITVDSLTRLPNNADSLLFEKGERLGEQIAKEYLPEDLASQEGTSLDPFTDQASALSVPNLKKLSKPNPNLIKPDQAKELFSKIDPEQFQDAQENLQKLKKKYSQLPDTRYPEEGTKRNSLEDLPFSKRIDISGNVGLQSTDPLILDSKIQLGYWINKKWLGGVGLSVREQFNKEDSVSTLTGDGIGYSLFTRYNLPKSFFVWAEMEWHINRSFFGEGQQTPKRWQQAHLVGVGREFKIGILQMLSMVLYDFNYRSNDLHSRPLVFRMGVRFTKRPK